MEHKSKIAITRSDVHFFSNLQICLAIECNRGVFGGKTDDSAVWVVSEDQAKLGAGSPTFDRCRGWPDRDKDG